MERNDGDGFGRIIESSGAPEPIIPSRAGPGGWSLPEQSLGLALIAGTAVGVVGALVWAAAAVSSGKQIGYLALGIGFVVGFVVRKAGRGTSWLYGVVAALCTAGSCVLGMVLSYAIQVALSESPTLDAAALERLFGVLFTVSFTEAIRASLDPVSGVFTLVATYQAFQLGYARPSKDEPVALP